MLGLIITTLGIAFLYNIIDFTYKQNIVYLYKKRNNDEEEMMKSATEVLVKLIKMNNFKVQNTTKSEKYTRLINYQIIINDLKKSCKKFSFLQAKYSQYDFPIQEMLTTTLTKEIKSILLFICLAKVFTHGSVKIE